MEHSDLIVKSEYLQNPKEAKFYIKNFKSIIKYLYLANNFHIYCLIITNETHEDIKDIRYHLNNNQKNPVFNEENLLFNCTTQEQQQWCDEFNFNYEINDSPIVFDNFQPIKLDGPPSWAFQNNSIFYCFYNDDNIKIIHLEGLEHNWNILHLLKNNIYTLISWPCYFHKWLYEYSCNSIYTRNENYNRKNIIFLSPNLDGILWAYEYGYNAILTNHNCFLDYNIFTINNDEPIKYNMVMNCRPELWKRPYLAESVSDLAYIKGYNFNKEDIYDYSKLKCKFMNKKIISSQEVNAIYNQSYCAGIFSEKEGACYSSSEYLLCGLPVISTFSKGGRDTWYTQHNSIIVEPTKEDVTNAVEQCILKMQSGEFNRQEIRDNHINMASQMRKNIINCIKYIFYLHNIEVDVSEYWEKQFFHKFIKNENYDYVFKILES